MNRSLLALPYLLLACSSPASEPSQPNDAGPRATDAAPILVDGGDVTFPDVKAHDAGAPMPCVQPAADTLPLGDDCFAYALSDWCAPYECGRTVHYFCAGGAMPAGDCHHAGTTYHGTATGFCCTDAVCVRYKRGDLLCDVDAGEIARSCPTVGPAPAAAEQCRKGSASEAGDPIYCCKQ